MAKSAKLPKDFTERASKKPAPKSQESWLKEVNGIVAFTQAKPNLIENSGRKWYDSMAAYYSARLSFLKANIPPGMVKTAAKALATDAAKRLP